MSIGMDASVTMATTAEDSSLYDWPKELLGGHKPVEWLWKFDLDAPADKLWPLITDSSRFNRALGLPVMEIEEKGGLLRGASVNGGVRLEWTELPWDWVANRFVSLTRIYHRGFVRALRLVCRLEDRGAGTRVLVYWGWVPRSLVGVALLRVGMPKIERAYRRVLSRLERDVQRGEATALLPRHRPELTAPEEARLEKIAESLYRQPISRELAQRLVEHIRGGDELELERIRVQALARQWDASREALLRVCLHATRLGLLEMSWDVICPHCRGVRAQAPHLGELPPQGMCDVCRIDFTTDRPSAVEITFHVHASVRQIPKRFYCSAEPATKRHMLLQHAIAPGAKAQLATRLEPGTYRARMRGQLSSGVLEIDASVPETRVSWLASQRAPALHAGIAPVLELRNDTAQEQLFVVERVSEEEDALRPAALFALQDFHDLFSEEYLSTDVQLHVGEQTILFTDIVGSTVFYRRRGDPAAFVEVKKHFARIFGAVAEHHGAVIKTIGDAAMAAFAAPLDAVRAAHAIACSFDEEATVRVRVSVHTGPCIAVNLNTRIDYFGSTVNLAAKLQSCANAGDIALSERVVAAAGVSEFLRANDAIIEQRSYRSEAFEDGIDVSCWRTDATRC